MATVQKRNGSYLIRCSAGYDMSGKQLRKSTTWIPAPNMTPKQEEKALQEAIIRFEIQVKEGKILDGNIRFVDFADKWLSDYAEKHLAPRTILHYKNVLRRINQAIGNIRLDKLQPHHLMKFYDNLGEEGVRSGGGKLSPKMIREHHNLISSILHTAVEWQVIFANPTERVKPPKLQRQEQQYLDENGAKRVIELLADADIKYRTAVIMLIYSGLRRGELCGLKWNDIDFENSIITIRRITQYLPHIGIIEKEPKTRSSMRTMNLPLEAFALLKEHRKWQAEQRIKLGDIWQDSDYIFTHWDGKPIHLDTLTNFFSKFAKKHDLPKGTTLHSLRHTNATLLIASGIPIRTVSSRLGHAQTSTTANIYAHAIQSADAKAAEVIGDILNPTQKLQKHIDNY